MFILQDLVQKLFKHPLSLRTLADFARMYQRQNNYALAETYAAQALAERRRALGPEDLRTMESAVDLALAYQLQGKFTESEPLAREAMESFIRRRAGWLGAISRCVAAGCEPVRSEKIWALRRN